ncbi:hypothetical protein H4CHR_02934 [Variovorax sp. PBS-H4]|uniref:hypothetical protein n=1 Tax=Variovorax sp. PBS-H4 TaxID=434008 RepID=UPI001316363D|nr:hypothetical protein [Variovorax sp. PBS-H4]VTU32061.1 hypothetical protein H4CHR_02934 [Variovorax sp. PBS-H4]
MELKHLYEMTSLERYNFWRTNLLEAQKFWATVNPDNVDLCDWRDPEGEELDEIVDYSTPPSCGTLACFGGWLPWAPYFAEMGVRQNPGRGTPEIGAGERYECGSNVAKYLFGEWYLFDSRESREGGTDHAVAATRIANRLAEVERVIDELTRPEA